jgi:hypothetical protein
MSQAEKPNTTNLSRRSALTGLSGAAIAGVAGAAAAGITPAVAVAGDDAELLALKPEFDPLFDLWRAMMLEQGADHKEFEALLREKTGLTRAEAYALDRDSRDWNAWHRTLYTMASGRAVPNPASQAWAPVRDRFYELADEILAYEAVTLEGLAVQARAFISSYSEMYDDEDGGAELGTWNFLASVCAFTGVPFPPF